MDSPALADPVCGMGVSPTSAHAHELNGTKYHFCSARCRDKFASDPSKYAGDAPPAQSGVAIARGKV